MKKLREEMDDICSVHGQRLYSYLIKEFPGGEVYDLDMMLNSLACALVRLRNQFVETKKHADFASLVSDILEDNK